MERGLMAEKELLERIEKLELQLRVAGQAPLLAPAAPLTPEQERRYVLKDILNTNLLSPEARKQFEQEYAEIGAKLEKAVRSRA
jgi:hypothetical protein